jgi:hypothetical protein
MPGISWTLCNAFGTLMGGIVGMTAGADEGPLTFSIETM